MRRHTKRLAAAAALALLAIWTAFRVLLGRSPPPTYRPSFSLKSKLQVVAARTTRVPTATAVTTRAPATAAAAASKSDCWMLLAMPSAPRDGGRDYLNATLDALLCQLAAAPPTPGRVCVAVYDVRADGGGDDAPFDRARRRVRSPDVLFVRGGAREPARRRAATTDLVARTRRQTADVARMLRALAPRTTAYLALLEDDWLLCEGGLRALLYLEAKASLYRPDWAALRFSYGLNGILLRSADAPALAAFLEDPAAERENKEPDAPVDHLAYRFLRGKYAGARAYFGARRIVAFRHTLFWHIGGVSAVQGSATSAERHRPPCFARTGEWLFDSERFHADECPDDDVWPCAPRPPPNSSRARRLRALARDAVAGSAGGARECGPTRLCWQRPRAQACRRPPAAEFAPEYRECTCAS